MNMKTKYFCSECQDEGLFDEDEIAYKYKLNVGGKFPVWEFVCKECAKKEE